MYETTSLRLLSKTHIVMSKNTKIWKPGQLVTINSKVYRVVKGRGACINCENINTGIWNYPCVMCLLHRHPFRGWILKKVNPNTAG